MMDNTRYVQRSGNSYNTKENMVMSRRSFKPAITIALGLWALVLGTLYYLGAF